MNGAISSDVEASGNDATKTQMVIDNQSAKIEGYAREFAENSLSPIIWIIIKMLERHKDDYSVKRMVDMVTPGVPMLIAQEGVMNIISKSDLTAKVGLGHMNQQQKMQGIAAIKQEQLSLETAGIMIDPKYKVAVAQEMAKAVGYENYNSFLPSEEELAQQNQVMQAVIQQATEQGIQLGQQQAMQQSQNQLNMAKVAEIQAKIDKMRADISSMQSEDEIKQAELLIEMLNQQLEHTLAMNSNVENRNVAVLL